MPHVDVNYWAVLVAAISNMVIGSIWYMPSVFGNAWMKLSGHKMGNGSMGMSYGLMFVAALVSSFVLSYFVSYAGATTWMTGLETGLWVAVGFVLATGAGSYIFSKKPFNLYLIDNGYQLVALGVAGIILATWR